jgi:DNA repair exonuclease SbcCD nuclease subunit
MSKSHPIAVAVADLHLSLLQPACRADKDWMAVQAGYLQQVKKIQNTYPLLQTCTPLPILCAGDIFDRWNAPPELINFALEHLPDGMLCVPGQHDLPLHRSDLMHRSGYGVLKQVGKIKDLSEGRVEAISEGAVFGYGWKEEIEPLHPPTKDVQIALIHRYVWTVESGYPGALQSSHLSSLMKSLKGYDVAIIGDNHKPFLKELKNGCTAYGCGTFIRRKTDEMDYQPSVGIIYSDGTVKRKRLDTSGDRFHEGAKDRPEIAFNMKEFIESLEGLGEHGLDFKAAIENHLKTEDVHPQVKEIILAALDNKV